MDDKLVDVLKQYWGYGEFLPLQREAIAAIEQGRDAVIVLPTGGGKSLCYQLPALTVGRALVVSPLIALMRDQVAALRQAGIEAACINSSMTSAATGEVMSSWKNGKLKLLYAAPERLLMPSFLNYLGTALPAFIAVDEAHCISQWGHDFRPEYRQLRTLRERFPQIPMVALTATANKLVRRDIAEQLTLREPEFLVGDFDRPNLHYRAERRTDRNTQIEEIMRAHAGKSGIVYCISRKDTEAVAEYLKGRGFKAAAYHAGLETQLRNSVQEAFTHERLDVVVATVAFGMGIDRSNVRFVIHAGLPGSIENYQQETGRAGRDGLPAECVLLFTVADKFKWQRIYRNEGGLAEDVAAARDKKLEQMANFANSRRCRHAMLVEYFGQEWGRDGCGNCDNCSDAPRKAMHPESTVIAQKILSCVARLKEQYGTSYVIHVLRGNTAQVQPAHCGLSTFRLMSDTPATTLRGWIDECIEQNLLVRSAGEYPTLILTAEGWSVLRGQKAAQLSAPAVRDVKASRERKRERIEQHKLHADAGLTPEQEELFEALRKTRMALARERGVPAYVILHDATMAQIAVRRPASVQELEAVPGMGRAKVASFGKQILETVRGVEGSVVMGDEDGA